MRRVRVYSVRRVYRMLAPLVHTTPTDVLANEGISPFRFGDRWFFAADEIDELVRMIQL